MSIDDTVSVAITVYDATPAVQDFGTIAILAEAPFSSEVRAYAPSSAGLSAMVTDGFTVNDEAYRKVAAIASQNPHTARPVKIIPRDTAPNAQEIEFVPAYTTAGKRVLMTIEYLGKEYEVDVTIQTGDTAADIIDDIVTDLGTITGLTITDGETKLTIKLTTPGAARFHVKDVLGLTMADVSVDAGVATDLAAGVLLDSDWYGLLIDSTSAAEIKAAAAWALSNDKLAAFSSLDSDNTTESDGVAYDLRALTNHNAVVLVTRDSQGSGEAGIMGRQFSRTPGSSTWAHKAISGQTPDAWSAAHFANLRANGALTYVTDQGVNHTYDGFACSGRFADITRGIAWLKARIREAVLAQIVNVEKIPYTQQGIGIIESAIYGILSQAQGNGLLASGWTVTSPAIADISTANKANRILPDIKFRATLAGAIQTVTVDGTVLV
ncbi:MAG: DUF3383 domain-containing protein [Bacteroidales bacterium]|nr:DUF3383 domain-containing protein [Bacteroidales bacterium]